MKNRFFTLVLLISSAACKNFTEVKTSEGLDNAQKSACTNDGNCIARLAWDPNPVEEEITGYRIEYGEVSRNDTQFTSYEHSVDVTGQTSAKLIGLKKKNYHLSIRALSGSEQSDLAPEITIHPENMKSN